MKSRCNLFGLLTRGVTTTHPLCSVFILSLLLCFCFFSVSVHAAVSNIPEMTDWQFQQAIDAYSGLTEDQKDIANFLTGSQGYAFAGISQSNLNSNFSSWDATIQSAKDFGAKMWEDINSRTNNIVNGMLGVTNDLSNFFGNAVTYAKSRNESFSAWLGNVGIDYNSSSEFRIQFGKDQAQDNVDYFGDEGLYNWQFSTGYITPVMFTFSFTTVTLNGSQNQTYYSYLNTMPMPHVKVSCYNQSGTPRSPYNFIGSDSVLSTYKYIFANTSNNSVYLCDANGNQLTTNFKFDQCVYYNGAVQYVSELGIYLRPQVINLNNYSSLLDLFYAINSNPSLILNMYDNANFNYVICLSDFVEGLYVGPSWSDRSVWNVNHDLNLSSTSQYVTVNSPTNVIYLDLNGFLHDLYDNPTIIYNYVVNNSIDGDGNPVDPSDFNPISKFVTIPASGISIGSDFFKLPSGFSLFDTYIADLWNNTKGLVSYCADIFSIFTPDEGIGLAYIVYGGIAVGVIGGIFSKFLL